jgi:hypothetical protein
MASDKPKFKIGDRVIIIVTPTFHLRTKIITCDFWNGKYYYNVTDAGAKWPESMLKADNDDS